MEENESRKGDLMTLSQKAEDLKTSGYTLLTVGILGAILMVLWAFGVLPINMAGYMKYVSIGVMGLLFVLFIISGAGSLKKAKEAAAGAVRENEKREEIISWFLSEYNGETADEAIREILSAKQFSAEETDGEEAEEETDVEAGSDELTEDAEPDDEEIADDPVSDLYFARESFIREKISGRFLEVDEALLSDIIEKLYSRLFEE